MRKILYHAYELYSPGAVDFHVDVDLSKLMTELAKDLNNCREGGVGIEGMTVGQVKATDPEDAMDQLRAGNWLKNKFYGNVQNPEED